MIFTGSGLGKLLGSETMGVPVIISFGEFFFDKGEDEEEY